MKTTLESVPWRWVALFFAVALLGAAPFNLGLAAPWLRANLAGTPFAVWTFLPAAAAPALGAIAARRLGPRTARVTRVLGEDPARNLLTALVPVVCFAATGGRAGVFALVAVIYGTGEEVGWRGYLADALEPIGAPGRLLLTAAMWWLWHMRFASRFDLVVFPLIVLASSVVLGHAARVTGSTLAPGAMHALVTLLAADGAPSRALLAAGGATVAVWVLLGIVWPQRPGEAGAPAASARA